MDLDQEREIHYSLFGQKLIVPRLGGRSRPGTRTGIASLPAEILLWIFHLLSSAGRRNPFSLKHYTSHIKNPHLCDCDHAWAPEILPSRCTLFPYAQSQVCRNWRDVLALQPTFWTRVIVSRKPGKHTPPQIFENYLRWSRDLQIEVYVGNVRDEGQYPSEGPLIREYNRILHPHVRRCKVIDYEVQCSTSLPCLLRELRDLPPFLETLRLKSDQIVDAQGPLSEGGYNSQEFHSIGQHITQSAQPFTSLNHLILNGRNFLLACAYLPKLLTNAGSIVVENYRKSLRLHPEMESIPFQFRGMLAILASNNHIRELKFNNLELQDMDDMKHERSEILPLQHLLVALHLRVLELTNVPIVTLYQSMANAQPASMALVILDSIHLSGFRPDVFFLFRRVELRNMSGADIKCFLKQWNGASLSLRDCPGLTDDVVNEMGVPNAPESPVPLGKLEIHNCHNFSVESLKAMMGSRHKHFLEVFQYHSALVASQAEFVPGLTVRGAKYHLTDEDRRWFNELTSLCHFEWQVSPPALQEADVDLDIEMEDDTELELENTIAGDAYSKIEEELDGERYTAPELVIDWPLDEPRSPPISALHEMLDPVLSPSDAELALWADAIFNSDNLLSNG